MSSSSSSVELRLVPLQLIATKEEAPAQKVPSEEQIKTMNIPQLLELEGRISCGIDNTESKLRAFYQTLRSHFTHADSEALSSVRKQIYELEKQQMTAEIEQTFAQQPSPLQLIVKYWYGDRRTQQKLIAILKNNKEIAELVAQEFAKDKFCFVISQDECYKQRPDLPFLTHEREELLTLLPIRSLRVEKIAKGFMAADLGTLITKMKSLTSLDTLDVLLWDCKPELGKTNITRLRCWISGSEQLSNIVNTMPMLRHLHLQLSSDSVRNTKFKCLQNATHLENLELSGRGWITDFTALLVNTPPSLRTAHISNGSIDDKDPQLAVRFGDNHLELLQLHNCGEYNISRFCAANIAKKVVRSKS